MKQFLIIAIFTLFISQAAFAQPGDEVTYGTNNVWIGYLYDNMDFTTYMGYVNEGIAANPNFDENFGGNTVNYPTNGSPVFTETFSARYKLIKNFAAGKYQFTVGADDGYRLSLDGGATWAINNWTDHSYTSTTYTTTLSGGNINMVLEYYENGGGNRVSFDLQTICTGSENETIYGTGNIWNGYIYDGINFNTYGGLVTEGVAANPSFDESFGGNNVTYITSACGIQTETFSARYRLNKTFANGTFTFIVGGDDGYRFSLDGGSTWAINNWNDHSYTSTTYVTALNGNYNMVLEYYENGGFNRVSINISGSVLPVKLIRFGGKKAGKNIKLNWDVTGEINSEYYEVERSANGTDFFSLAKVNTSQGTTVGTDKSYGYTDISPLAGNNYYRLRMVDKDQKFTYSPITRIVYEDKSSVSIFPTINTGGNIYLKTSVNLKNATIELYDINGKKLQETKLTPNITAGQTISLPLHSDLLAKGTYVVICKSAGNVVTKQMIITQ